VASDEHILKKPTAGGRGLGSFTRKLLTGGLLFLSGFALVIASLVWSFWGNSTKKPLVSGVTFSVKYARELDLEPKEVLAALISDLGVRHFRLMSYWDLHEAVPGVYDFSELDWQMKMAEESGSKVTLAIGLRQPRWPECHTPGWAKELNDTQKRESLYRYMTKTVERYRTSPALESYQLENEALNTSFGECHDFDRARLVHEFDLVHSLDSTHPVLVSVSNEFGIPFGQPRGDLVGFSIYHRVYDSHVTKGYYEYPIPAWYHGLRAAIIARITHRTTVIHELQAEPWGPKATKDISLEEQAKSMNPDILAGRYGYAKATGIRQFDFWGGEWWYWRKTKFGDSTLWDTARSFYR
jgi:hypothetical protein